MVNDFPTAEEARMLAESKITNQKEFLTLRNLILEAAKNGKKFINYSYQISDENQEILKRAGYKLVEHTLPSIDWVTGTKHEVHYCTAIYW